LHIKSPHFIFEYSESCRWPTPAKQDGAGCVFGDMLFKLLAPQALKRPATAIQGIRFGEIGEFAA